MTESFFLSAIDPNPYQTRQREDDAHLHNLALDIATRGLLQTPVARRVGDRYQLAFGHSRKAAFEVLSMFSHDRVEWDAAEFPADKFDPALWNAMPLEIRELTDREMAEFAISENAQRKNLNAIETAIAAKRYMQDFDVSQIETAHLFGYSDASVLTHLFNLLELPEAVQPYIAAGTFPQRFARQGVYRAVARLDVKRAITIAETVARADENEREGEFENQMQDALRKCTRNLSWGVAWKDDWKPNAALVAELARPDKGEPNPLPSPSCKGCKFNLRFQHTQYCVQPTCFHFKGRIFAYVKAQQVAKEKQIAAATPQEKTTVLWNGDPNSSDYARKAMEKAPELVRFIPVEEKSEREDWQKKNTRSLVLGSEYVALAVTDKKALEAKIGKPTAQKKEERDHAAQEKARLEAERKREETRKHKWNQCVELYRNVARAWSAGITLVEPFPSLILEAAYMSEEETLCADLGKFKDLKGRAKTEYLLRCLLQQRVDVQSYAPDPEVCQREFVELAGELKLKLPTGWDAVLSADKGNGKGKTDGNARTKAKRAKK